MYSKQIKENMNNALNKILILVITITVSGYGTAKNSTILIDPPIVVLPPVGDPEYPPVGKPELPELPPYTCAYAAC